MKIELKKISFNERMSEETNCFVADLYINGKMVGYVKNDGRGGSTDYRGNCKEDHQVITEAETYCKTLPKVKVGDMEWEQSLEGVIDEVFEDYLNQKETKRKQKLMEKQIMYGIPGGYSYRTLSWSKKKLSEIPLITLQLTVKRIREEECKDGVVILNTNLAELGVI